MLTKLKSFWAKFTNQVDSNEKWFNTPDEAYDALFNRGELFNAETSYPALTQSQIQYLIDMNKKTLQYEFETLAIRKHCAKDLWNMCDKSNPQTCTKFETLNYFRNSIREGQYKIKALSEIQATLKKMRSSGWY